MPEVSKYNVFMTKAEHRIIEWLINMSFIIWGSYKLRINVKVT